MSPHRERSMRALRATGVLTAAAILVLVVSALTTPDDDDVATELAPLSPTEPEVVGGLVSMATSLVLCFAALWFLLWVTERVAARVAERRATR